MSKLRVASFSLSLDGYGAGPGQSAAEPLGQGGEALHDWYVPTRTFQQMHGRSDGTTGVDDEFAVRANANLGAWIMGRNMFGPVPGAAPDDNWKGWWGNNPPFHGPVFVLTHRVQAAIPMEGGTTYHFVADGIEAGLRRAVAAAAGRDVLVSGGVDVIRQYLRAGLIDELHLAIVPILLGSGEHLFAGIDLPSLGYRVAEHVAGEKATHVVLTRQP